MLIFRLTKIMKYITKKVIKGKAYYYFQYKTHSKFIGHVLPDDLKKQLLDFFYGVGGLEQENLSVVAKESFKYGNLSELERLHYWHIALNHELFKREYNTFYLHFASIFTYHSNRSEGSQVTRNEIDRFVESGIRKPKTRAHQEIFNSLQALRYAFSPEMKWNMKNIKHIHSLLLSDLDPLIAGQWKKENNVAPNNQPTIDASQVSREMKDLMDWLTTEFKTHPYPPTLALKFYCRFEKIHPFLDGNGRVGRILLNAILHKFGYPPVVFFTENHREHSSGIQLALQGRYTKINKHFLLQVKKTNEKLISIAK